MIKNEINEVNDKFPNIYHDGKNLLCLAIQCTINYPVTFRDYDGPSRKVLLLLDDLEEDKSFLSSVYLYMRNELSIPKRNEISFELRKWIDYELDRRYGDAGYYLETFEIVDCNDIISASGKY
jgi:hypothetical protein